MVGGNHVSHQHINQLPILNQDTLPGKKKTNSRCMNVLWVKNNIYVLFFFESYSLRDSCVNLFFLCLLMCVVKFYHMIFLLILIYNILV